MPASEATSLSGRSFADRAISKSEGNDTVPSPTSLKMHVLSQMQFISNYKEFTTMRDGLPVLWETSLFEGVRYFLFTF